MHTLADISRTQDAYRVLPRVPMEDVHLLWHCDFWDGPKSGVLRLKGEQCWFQMIAENPDEDFRGWYRRFVIVRLTPEQLAEVHYWHDLFRKHVGWNTDFVKSDPSYYKGLQPREQWEKFYQPYSKRAPLDLSTNEVLCWFED